MSRVAEPLQCSGCGANLKPKEDGSGLWKCEFCENLMLLICLAIYMRLK